MPQQMAHVFIVDPATFPVHLEYQFAGTTSGLTRQRSIGLYADIARVRPGDRAYFYLLNQGFYGPFLVDPDANGVWWDKLDPSYLQDQLHHRLIYRVAVVADNTYPLAISEWEALDRYLREPERCLWSLVYRKLKGARGCTMIFPWEDDFLFSLIRETNEAKGKRPLQIGEHENITWNAVSREIEVVAGTFPAYAPPSTEHLGTPEDPSIKLRLASGAESYLQAFLTKNYGRFPDTEIVFGKSETLNWVGNEVACGLGMQKIDLFAINGTASNPEFRIIELKKDPPDDRTVWQLQRYIEWTKRFVVGAASHNIQPILLCRNLQRIRHSERVIDSFKAFNAISFALPLQYIECVKIAPSGELRFQKVDYI